MLFYILSISFFLLGMYIVTINWIGFWLSYKKNIYTGSWIPLLAGILVMTALLFFPNNNVKKFCWIGLFIDWGSVPGIVYTLWRIHKDSHK